MADTLTSLLNSEIQRGDTELSETLETYLDGLEEGVYETANGTLTVEITEGELDTITGTVRDNQSAITSTAWYAGNTTETASQELIDLVTGQAQAGVYFIYDLDTSFTGATFADALYWNGNQVTTATFNAATFNGTFALGATEGGKLLTWDSNKPFLEGLELDGTNLNLQIV